MKIKIFLIGVVSFISVLCLFANVHNSTSSLNRIATGKSALQEGKSWYYVTLMYLPNRLIDLSDVITMQGGIGPQASLGISITKYAQLEGSYGDDYFISKGFNRQIGGGYQGGNSLGIGYWNDKNEVVDSTFGNIFPYVDMEYGKSCQNSDVYKNGQKDFWSIETGGGWIVNFEFGIHPVALANFFTGFFFYRLGNTSDI